jgi:hypothetical protein
MVRSPAKYHKFPRRTEVKHFEPNLNNDWLIRCTVNYALRDTKGFCADGKMFPRLTRNEQLGTRTAQATEERKLSIYR